MSFAYISNKFQIPSEKCKGYRIKKIWNNLFPKVAMELNLEDQHLIIRICYSEKQTSVQLSHP